MFVIYGRRTARIKGFSDSQHYCKSCHSFDLVIKVYRDYLHIFFLPLFPIGHKKVKIKCNNCGEPCKVDELEKQYEGTTKTPFYLYTGVILFSIIVLQLINANLNTQNEKARFLESPKVGDVYRIRKDENNSTTYYFLRVCRIKGDSVFAYHNNLVYDGFINKLNGDDFFVKDDELPFTKRELKVMLDKGEINYVERKYEDNTGYNRLK